MRQDVQGDPRAQARTYRDVWETPSFEVATGAEAFKDDEGFENDEGFKDDEGDEVNDVQILMPLKLSRVVQPACVSHMPVLNNLSLLTVSYTL